MRQEGRNGWEQTKASNVTRRTLAIFINAGTKHALKPCEIAKQINEDYHAVYSAIRRFCKYGFVKSVRRVIGRRVVSFYILNDKAAALEYMGHSDLAFLGGVPRSPFMDWVDLGRAVFESGAVRFMVDGFVCDRIRSFLGGSVRARSRDRAQQLSYGCSSFSLNISRYGCATLWVKTGDWISDFLDFLVNCGLDEGNRVHVFRKMAENLSDAQVSVEAPVLSRDVPEVTIKTKVGDETLLSRICGSHFPKELEVSGSLGPVQNFLSALAGAQHFSMLEWIQADRLDKITRAVEVLIETFDRTAKALESISRESVPSKLRERQEATEGRGKSDLYIV